MYFELWEVFSVVLMPKSDDATATSL
jgi:hypothetical protein